MTRPMRWGILGAAKITRTALVPALQTAKGAELVALGTSDPVKAAPFLAVVPGLRVMGYEDLLAEPSVDAVYIPLPNHLHVDWTIRALRAGKHVLCERPLALAVSDIDRVIAARDATGLLAAEGFMVAHHPLWARDLLAEGAIGLPGHVEGMFTYYNTGPANIRGFFAQIS